MKHTQLLDALRNIKKQWVSFLSIVLIVMLGVMVYLGINFAANSMKQGGDKYYEETNFKDVEIDATLLMSDIDLEEIKKTPGVSDAEGVFMTTGYIKSRAVTIQSVTSRISVPILLSGRLPETETECVLEQALLDKCSLKVGDSVTVKNASGKAPKFLKHKKYSIVGSVLHPDHITVKLPENLYVLVDESAFDHEKLNDHFMKAEITLKASNGKNTFDEVYFEASKDTMAALGELAVVRSAARDDEIYEEGVVQIKEGEDQLAAGRAKLASARSELDGKHEEIEAAQKKLDDGETQLEDAKKQLAEGEQKLADGKKELAEAEAKLADGKKELADGKKQLADGKKKLKTAETKLKKGKAKLEKTKKQLADGKKELADGKKELADGKKQLEDGKKQIEEGTKKLEDARKELDDAKKELEEKKEELQKAKEKLDKAEKELADGKKKLDAAKKALDAGKTTLDNAKAQLDSGKTQLEEAYTQIMTTKNTVRSTVKELLKDNMTEKEYAKLEWAPDYGVTCDADTNVSITQTIELTTEDTIVLNQSLEKNMRTMLANHGTTGARADDIVARAKKDPDYKTAEDAMSSLSGSITLWNDQHGTYLTAKKKYDDGVKEYNKKKRDYEEGQRKYEKGLKEYEEGKKKYKEGKDKYDKALKEYEQGEKDYEEGLKKLEDGKAKYEDGLKRYEEGKKQYKDGVKKYKAGLKKYKAGVKKYKKGLKDYNKGKAKYEKGLSDYKKGQKQYQAGLKKYKKGLKEYNAGVKKYEKAKAKYEDGLKEYEESSKKLSEARATIEEKEREYNDGVTQIRNGQEELTTSKEKLENLEKCKWFTFDRRSNAAYVDLNMVAGNLSSLGMTFSLLFILVGAMVCYATIGRMVDEQRSLVGATKALGLYNREIFAKYLTFGLSSGALGVLLGVLLADGVLQWAVLSGYANMYVMGQVPGTLVPILTCIVTVFGLVIAVGAVYIATSKLLSSTAISLMKEDTPKPKKRKSGKSGGSLYTGLIISNMITDLRRVAVTVVSVAGCCALLVIGFTLKFSVDGVMDIQYGQIVKYDLNLNYNPQASGNVEHDIEQVLDEWGLEYYPIYNSFLTYNVTDSMEIGQLAVADDNRYTDFYSLQDAKSGVGLSLPDTGILIQKRLAETYNLKVGDEFTVYDSNSKEHTVTVSGIFNNYTGRTMVMSHSAYEKLFGEDVRNNRYLVKVDPEKMEDLKADLKEIKGYNSLGRSDTSRALFASISTILNALIVGLIIMAAMMALFVLLNLANMYLLQKKRELTIMRINGFTIKEVKRYVATETYITTAVGILLGFALGGGMAYKIIRSLEQPHIQLIRSISIPGWALAAVITAAMSILLNQFAMRNIKNLSLTDM